MSPGIGHVGGRTPRSAADARVGLSLLGGNLVLVAEVGQGADCGPGGPPSKGLGVDPPQQEGA